MKIILAALLLFTNLAQASTLSQAQTAVLERAKRSNWFQVEVLEVRSVHRSHTVVMIGETHIKSANAAQLGRDILSQFRFRGVEGIPLQQSKNWFTKIMGKFSTVTQEGMRDIFGVQDSTIRDATSSGLYISPIGSIVVEGRLRPELRGQSDRLIREWLPGSKPISVGLESGNPDDYRKKCTGLICDPIYAVRNIQMADNIKALLETYPEIDPLLVIVGRLHVPKMKSLLLENR